MGVEPLYFFTFAVGKVGAGGIAPQPPRKVEPQQVNMGKSLNRLWVRIWNEDARVLFE
jgi:hypothetical protein